MKRRTLVAAGLMLPAVRPAAGAGRLSVEARPDLRALPAGRRGRHHRPAARPCDGPAGQAVGRGGEQARRRRLGGRRAGRAGHARWLHAAAGAVVDLRAAGGRSPAGTAAGLRARPVRARRPDQRRPDGAGGARRRSLQDAEGPCRRGQGQARHDQLRLVGRVRHAACGDGDLRPGRRPSKLFHIPYQGGGPAVAALLAGQIDALASGPAPAIGQIKAGKMRALAVWGDKRLAAMPDVPSMKELGYDATFYIWSGLFAPAATPQPVMTALREIVKRTVEDPEFKEAMDKVETPITYLDAPQFKTFLDRDAAETEGRGRAHRQHENPSQEPPPADARPPPGSAPRRHLGGRCDGTAEAGRGVRVDPRPNPDIHVQREHCTSATTDCVSPTPDQRLPDTTSADPEASISLNWNSIR